MRSGRLLIPCDHYVAGTKMRRSHIIYSDDHGTSWKIGGVVGDHTNECQAALITTPQGRLVFSNPASEKRERMTVRASRDAGKTWETVRVLHEGPAAYSALVALRDGGVGCLYERGEKSSYETMTFARLRLP